VHVGSLPAASPDPLAMDGASSDVPAAERVTAIRQRSA
jgi:hypothetical protein